jgi:hypothetical protein
MAIVQQIQAHERIGPMPSKETSELARRAELIYEQHWKADLEKTHLNYFVAIEPDPGDCFLGQTLSEAASAARKAYPDRRSFLTRVGHPATLHIGAHVA